MIDDPNAGGLRKAKTPALRGGGTRAVSRRSAAAIGLSVLMTRLERAAARQISSRTCPDQRKAGAAERRRNGVTDAHVLEARWGERL
jgi:hypothetical protein